MAVSDTVLSLHHDSSLSHCEKRVSILVLKMLVSRDTVLVSTILDRPADCSL